MILDKLNDFVYEQASLFLTRWRACCFFVICMLLSEVAFKVFESGFWSGTLSQAVQVFAGIFELSVLVFVSIFLLCFLITPMVSKLLSLWIVSVEFKRAAGAIEGIGLKAGLVSRDDVFKYRDKAVAGEASISRMKGVNESFITSLIFGGVSCFYQEVWALYYSLLLVSPILFFFSVQNIFATYLKTVFFYKKIAENLSST